MNLLRTMKTNTYLLVVHHEGMMGLPVDFCPFDSLLPKKEIHISYTSFPAKHKGQLHEFWIHRLSSTETELPFHTR